MIKARVGKIETIECVSCGYTKHTIRDSYEARWDDDEHDISAGTTYDFMECNGCQRGTLRTTSWFSEEPGHTVALWPTRDSDIAIRKPRTFSNLDWGTPLESVYRQTLTAFNNKLPTLAGAGIRLLIEGVCQDQKIKKGKVYSEEGKVIRDKTTRRIILRDNLDGKINGLWSKGLISRNQAQVLHQLRKLGNDAAHALDQPPLSLIEECLNAAEHLFVQVYDQPELLKKLMNRKKPKK